LCIDAAAAADDDDTAAADYHLKNKDHLNSEVVSYLLAPTPFPLLAIISFTLDGCSRFSHIDNLSYGQSGLLQLA